MPKCIYILPALLLSSSAYATQFQPMAFLSNERQTKFESPKWVIHPERQYQAVLETTQGNMILELYPQVAPKTVNSFVFLALNHFYDGVVFHRVLESFMAQTGDPTGTGSGGPGYQFFVEYDSKFNFDKPGVLGMARSQSLYSNGSQFFITFVPYASLNGQYTVFGQLISGLDVLGKIQKVNPSQPDPKVKLDLISKVTILESVSP